MDDKKYLLFSAIGFNDPVGFELDKDSIKKRINNYQEQNKIIEEYKNKIKEYKNKIIKEYKNKIEEYKNKIEYDLRNKEKIYSEGSMLSIVRKFKPERVMLFFTDDMFIRKNNNGKSIDFILKEEIKKRSNKCSDDNILIKRSNIIANSFDDDLVDNENKNFSEMIDELREGYEDYEVLINITSGTNQIKTKLILECIYGKENNIKAVYITPPNIRKLINNEEEYIDDDGDYSYTEEIDTNYKKEYKKEEKDKVNYLEYLCEEYENFESELNENKYVSPNFDIFIKSKIKNQISALLEKSYEYKACYDLFQNDSFINNNCKDVLKLLKYADLISNLKYTDDDLKNNGIDITDKCLEYFQNKLNFIKNDSERFFELIKNDSNKKTVLTEDDIKKIVNLIKEDSDKLLLLIEYFYIMKLKQQKGDLSDFVLRLEPFLKYILDEFSFYKEYSIYKELIKIKNNLRHTIAHQMVNVSEDDIQIESGISSEAIINKCADLLKLICGKNFDKEYFVYDEINKKILEKL